MSGYADADPLAHAASPDNIGFDTAFFVEHVSLVELRKYEALEPNKWVRTRNFENKIDQQ